jgi:hypothetical protein
MSLRLVKQFSGNGTVYQDAVVIQRNAQYEIDVSRDFIPSLTGASEVAGMFHISGLIAPPGLLPLGPRLKCVTCSGPHFLDTKRAFS